MTLENSTTQIPESKEVEEHRRSQISRRPTGSQIEDAVEHFDNPDYAVFDDKFGGVNDGTERSQARREQADAEDAERKNRRANFVRKAVNVGKVAAVSAVLAIGGETSGARKATTDAIQSVGASAEPAVSGLVSEAKGIFTGDPDPLANYTGDDADKNVNAGNNSGNSSDSQPATAPTESPVYEGVHTPDAPMDSNLPTAPEEKEFGQQLVEQNAQAEQKAADTLAQSGGTPYQPETGGAESQIR